MNIYMIDIAETKWSLNDEIRLTRKIIIHGIQSDIYQQILL